MRKTMTCAVAVVLASGLLSGCSAGPNQDAVEATSAFSEKLSAWSAELSAAVETARANTLSLVFASDAAENKQVLAAVEELLGYGDVLRSYPMTPELAAGFDLVLDRHTELAEKIAATIEDTPDEFDQRLALKELQEEYEQKVYDEALPPLEALEDDAQAQALTAAAIEATAPGATGK